MANVKVIFLGKEYFISDQLPILVPILHDFDGYKESLIEILLKQMDRNDYVGGADEDFVKWAQPISNIAKKIIKKAADNGVYDLTEYDIVESNPGYQRLREICRETIKQITQSLAKAIDDYVEGYKEAYASAASNITGSGVGILTNSLGSALLYTAMEGSVLKKQARQADKEFSESLRRLGSRNQNKREQDETRIKATIYYPGCKDAIEMLLAFMLGEYLKKLDEKGVIICSEIVNYDIKASSEIMKNLNVIPQKAEVLGKAFEKCPYNADVYATALDLMLIDDESLNTVQYMKMDGDFASYIEDKIGKISTPNDIPKILKGKSDFIRMLAKVRGVSENECRKMLFYDAYKSMVKQYNSLSKAINGKSACEKYSEGIKRTDDIRKYVKESIDKIIDNNTFSVLVTCGFNSAIEDITPKNYKGVSDKEHIDAYILDRLSEECQSIAEERARKKQEDERIREKEEERKKTIQKKKRALLIVICIVVLIVLVLFVFIIPERNYNNAIKAFEQGEYSEAYSMFEALGKYKDSKEKALEAEYNIYLEMIETSESIDEIRKTIERLERKKDQNYSRIIRRGEERIIELKKELAIDLVMNSTDYEDVRIAVDYLKNNYPYSVYIKIGEERLEELR